MRWETAQKMRNRYVFAALLLFVLAAAGFGFIRICQNVETERADQEFTVVTSFYPMYIAALNVIGDAPGVKLENLSEPQTGCLHDYQLTPQDMKLLSGADVFIINGGGIESFLADVAEAYPDLIIVSAETIPNKQESGDAGTDTHGHSHEENPHMWMSMPHYLQQVQKITAGLSAADELRGKIYQKNAKIYEEKINGLVSASESLKEAADGENIIIFHEAYEYLAEDYGMLVSGVLDLDEERQVSAGEVAGIVNTIRDKKIRVLLAEEQYGKDLGNTIEAETDCRVYYLNTLVRGGYDPDSWLTGMKENLKILSEAFSVQMK